MIARAPEKTLADDRKDIRFPSPRETYGFLDLSRWPTKFRSLLPLVPGVGPTLSIAAEAARTAELEKQVAIILERMSKFVARVEHLERQGSKPASTDLILKSMRIASEETEMWKPRVLANIVGMLEDDEREMLKNIYVSIVESLSTLDVVVMFSIASKEVPNISPDLAIEFNRRALERQEVDDARQSALARLSASGVLIGQEESPRFSSFGLRLLELFQ